MGLSEDGRQAVIGALAGEVLEAVALGAKAEKALLQDSNGSYRSAIES